MLTVIDGTVSIMDGIFASASEYGQFFDSGRRILPSVQDQHAYLIECMISNIYDRLGTPYSNGKRLGDRAYDCSGIVCWSLGSIGFKLKPSINLFMDMEDGETTAQGLSGLNSIYWEKYDVTVPMNSLSKDFNNYDDVARLQRGDLVFCRNSKGTKVGHVMVYLGTTVTAHYRGTLVAEIRPALKQLYYCTKRFGPF